MQLYVVEIIFHSGVSQNLEYTCICIIHLELDLKNSNKNLILTIRKRE